MAKFYSTKSASLCEIALEDMVIWMRTDSRGSNIMNALFEALELLGLGRIKMGGPFGPDV